jgi:hypothetical protein
MADITITIKDDVLTKVIEAFCASYGYIPTVSDSDNPGQTMPNPVTATEFTRGKVFEYIEDVTKSYFIRQAQETATAAAKQTVESISI